MKRSTEYGLKYTEPQKNRYKVVYCFILKNAIT